MEILKRHAWILALGLLALLPGCAKQQPGGANQAADAKDWSEHTQGLPFVIGYEKGMEAAKSQDKPAMLFVTTTWCGYCKKLASEDLTDPAVKKLLENFVLVIVDGDTESAAAEKLGADGFPTIVFQTPSGETLEVCHGYVPVGQFKSTVESALAKVHKA